MEPENRVNTRSGIESRVPASARSLERMRMAAYDGSEIDDGDEDVQLIAALAKEAEATLSAPKPAPAPGPRRFTIPAADDALDVFRETRPERPRPRVLQNLEVEAVEMDDLLQQLSTTAAALRLRRAA